MNIFKRLFYLIFGTKQKRDLKKMRPLVDKILVFEQAISSMNNDELHDQTKKFKERLSKGESLDDILPEAFATVREASVRVLGMRHFDVQMMGGIAMHNNTIAEMKTGEGKTLVATLPLYLNGLTGKGVHLITVNDYLAKRDASWMAPIYMFLDLSVGIIAHEKSYRVEWDDISQYTVRTVECSRKEAYAQDITYGTNNEYGFDYLRDNMVFNLDQKVQRGFYFAIVDEVDSILIDEARTPLIISGPSETNTDIYYKVDKVIPRMEKAELDEKGELIEGTGDFAIFEKEKNAVITEQGVNKVEKLLGVKDLFAPQNAQLYHNVTQALRAHHLYENNVAYVVEGGEVVIVDEFTGRKMPGRRWSDGLHQAIEAKERLTIKQEFQTLATITFQNFFKMFEKLAGMTGTAETEATEFYSFYKLDVASIPTNKPITRDDKPDKIFINEKAKYNAIARDVKELQKKGQPVLLGTISVEKSEVLSALLKRQGVKHNVLNAKFHEKEADIVSRAGNPGAVTIATNMAGRGTDIKLGEGVIEAGGLYVIGSERHEARRIDNQLRGRSGRQGDPGASQFYVSLQDDLMRLFGMDNRIGMMSAMGFSEDEEIQSKMISNAIERAQKRVETRNFEIRKNLLEYDNIMNEQRTYIYKMRDRILDAKNNLTLIDDLIKESIEFYLHNTFARPEKPDFWEKEEVSRWLKINFNSDAELDFTHMDYQTAFDMLAKEVKKHVWDHFKNVPDEVKAEGLKYVVLNVLDQKWKEHLRNIDSLQEGIGLQGYAQKNPLVEYQLASSDMFGAMKDNFKLESLSTLSRLQIQANFVPREEEFESTPSHVQTIHDSAGHFESVAAGPGAPPKGPHKPQPAHRQSKPGRNEPCWCGSGKKYKSCHMHDDEEKERASYAQ